MASVDVDFPARNLACHTQNPSPRLPVVCLRFTARLRFGVSRPARPNRLSATSTVVLDVGRARANETASVLHSPRFPASALGRTS